MAEECFVCKNIKPTLDMEIHHVKYDPEMQIRVCKSCHNKIHHTRNYQHLIQYDIEESRKYYENLRGEYQHLMLTIHPIELDKLDKIAKENNKTRSGMIQRLIQNYKL